MRNGLTGHLDDILAAAGVGLIAYGLSYWSLPVSIVFLGGAFVLAGVLVGGRWRR